MHKLAQTAFVLFASLLLHAGALGGISLGGAPSPSAMPGPSLSPSPLQWVEVVAEVPGQLPLTPPGISETHASSPPPSEGLSLKREREKMGKPQVYAKKPPPPLRAQEVSPLTQLEDAPSPPRPEAFSSLSLMGEELGEGDVQSNSGGGLLRPHAAMPMANHGHFGHSGKASNHAYGVGEDSALQQRLQANAHGCYPLRARRFRFQGTARLAFCVDTQGMATQTRLSESSGHNSLDEAALDCVLKKAQPLPASSRGRCFVAPIAFVAR